MHEVSLTQDENAQLMFMLLLCFLNTPAGDRGGG